MCAESVGERGGRGLHRPGAPAVLVLRLCLSGEGVASAEEHGQGLRLGRVQRHGDERGPELVDTVPGQTVRGECLAQRRARSGRRSAAGLPRCHSGPGLFGALDDGGRGDRHDGEDLCTLRIELGEHTGQNLEGGGSSTAPVLQHNGSAASASVHAATTASSDSASSLPGSVVSFMSRPMRCDRAWSYAVIT
ncbi:hypothetical protein [Streptomyces lavendulocolor]|uniref:hypothetical protein n=1 Tax=Streptomyces lavendulocolor TaxID=67316 RepID=UPI003C2DEC21